MRENDKKMKKWVKKVGNGINFQMNKVIDISEGILENIKKKRERELLELEEFKNRFLFLRDNILTTEIDPLFYFLIKLQTSFPRNKYTLKERRKLFREISGFLEQHPEVRRRLLAIISKKIDEFINEDFLNEAQEKKDFFYVMAKRLKLSTLKDLLQQVQRKIDYKKEERKVFQIETNLQYIQSGDHFERISYLMGLISEARDLRILISVRDNLILKIRNYIVKEQKLHIKKTILDLGTKFTRIMIPEISEACDIQDRNLILETIHEMISENLINAQFFSSTASVVFNQVADHGVLDELDKEFVSWVENEHSKEGKI